jgi:hypothetical protein
MDVMKKVISRMSKLYYFYKEMFSAVNIQMSEEQIKSIFYAYYLGAAPNQHYFFFGEKGFKQILDDYDIKLNLHKQEFLDNINSSDLSENDLNNIVIGILRATNSTDGYNRLFENFDDISDAYINGDVTDVRLVRNQENFVVTVPVMLGIYLLISSN